MCKKNLSILKVYNVIFEVIIIKVVINFIIDFGIAVKGVPLYSKFNDLVNKRKYSRTEFYL
jgi:hypothetical protein